MASSSGPRVRKRTVTQGKPREGPGAGTQLCEETLRDQGFSSSRRDGLGDGEGGRQQRDNGHKLKQGWEGENSLFGQSGSGSGC